MIDIEVFILKVVINEAERENRCQKVIKIKVIVKHKNLRNLKRKLLLPQILESLQMRLCLE